QDRISPNHNCLHRPSQQDPSRARLAALFQIDVALSKNEWLSVARARAVSTACCSPRYFTVPAKPASADIRTRRHTWHRLNLRENNFVRKFATEPFLVGILLLVGALTFYYFAVLRVDYNRTALFDLDPHPDATDYFAEGKHYLRTGGRPSGLVSLNTLCQNTFCGACFHVRHRKENA